MPHVMVLLSRSRLAKMYSLHDFITGLSSKRGMNGKGNLNHCECEENSSSLEQHDHFGQLVRLDTRLRRSDRYCEVLCIRIIETKSHALFMDWRCKAYRPPHGRRPYLYRE